jgi:hypothetical protein
MSGKERERYRVFQLYCAKDQKSLRSHFGKKTKSLCVQSPASERLVNMIKEITAEKST